MITRLHILLIFFLACITFFFATWSPTGNITEFPKYWWDEAFTLEQARTFLEVGRVDFTTAPNTPSGKAITLSANGPAVSIPLAGIFKIFGAGVLQARLYMLGWMFLTIGALFFVLKRFFDFETAAFGTLLVITFASFYANGRTATGDIPGLFFLLVGLYLFLEKRALFWSGVFVTLAAVTKTSVFHMTLPAAGLTLVGGLGYAIFSNTTLRKCIQNISAKTFLKQPLAMGAGMVLVILLWFAILLPLPYSFSDLQPAVEFYQNPTHKASVLNQFAKGLPPILFSSTVGYFGLLFFIILFGYKKGAFETPQQKGLLVFFFIYTTLQAIVFLRSPGWIRYLIGWQILALVLVFPALRKLVRNQAVFIVFALAIFQSVQYLYFSNILPREDLTPRAEAINRLLAENPGSTIGFVDDPMTAALIPADKKFQYVRIGGDTYIGKPIQNYQPEELPRYVMGDFREKDLKIIEQYYEPFQLENGANIFRKK